MSLWMIRAGQRGEYEQKFINDKCFYITWNDLKCDLSCFSSRDDLKNKLKELYPDDKNNTLRTWASQLWSASHEIKKGDWIVLPLKNQPVIYIGEVPQHISLLQRHSILIITKSQ